MTQYEISEEDAKFISDGLRMLLSTTNFEEEKIIKDAIIGDTITEVEKAIPKYVRQIEFHPNYCPTCYANLGGSCNDGYYKNPHYEICPFCRQRLKYK